jgi:hypothetical protein
MAPAFRPTDPVAEVETLATPHDAALYIAMLPKAGRDSEEWQAVMEALLLQSELSGKAARSVS